MAFLDQLKSRLLKIWAALTKTQKILFSTLGITMLMSILIFSLLIGRVNYIPLYTNLSAQDAHQVIAYLNAQGIDNKVSTDGQSILVDRHEVHKLRLQLAGEGIPQGGVIGFEIFDTTRMGTTEFERQINFYRALSGELSRTISEISGVENARVQIAVPQQRLFIADEKPMQATVLLKIAPFATLNQNNIKSIANLVAGSVEGLTPAKVVIVDDQGNLLSEGLMQFAESFAAQDLAMNNLELQRFFEKQLQHDLERMLMPVLGLHNFVLNVNAILNFDLVEEQSRTYEPVVGDRGIIRSEQIVEERFSGSPVTTEGVPGVDTNIPLYEAFGVSQETESDYFERITNYEINERIVTHSYAPGSLEKVSIGVMINRDLNEEQLQSIRETIAAAVGLDQTRGDQLYITQLTFDDSLAAEIALLEEQQALEQQRQFYLYVGAIVMIALVLMFIIRRITAIARYQKSEATAPPTDVTADATKKEEIPDEEKEWRRIKEEIAKLTNSKPQETASLLKAWLTEE